MIHIKKLITVILFCTILTCIAKQEEIGDSWHFDTQILRDHQQTKLRLLEENFKEVIFENDDKTKLAGLLLERENARATIIFSHGFCPGGKEVFAPFVKIAPQDCNLLFLDQKGYGDSPGPGLIIKLRNYGKDNYKDITGAIDFLQNQNPQIADLPIIIFGWCSGAFHSATAVLKLQDQIEEKNIKGLIFDSGFSSVMQISDVPARHIKENYIPSFFTKFYAGDKKRTKRSYICKLATFASSAFLKILELFIKPPVKKRETETTLSDKSQNINIPVLVIHNQDDQLSKWEDVQPMVNNIPNKDLWLIKPGQSSHANNHLKLKEDYKEKMGSWIDKILT